MQIFKNRPLALLCLIFIVFSVSALSIAFEFMPILLVLLSVISVVTIIIAIFAKQHKIGAVFLLLCTLFALSATLIQYSSQLHKEEILSFEGEHNVELIITEQTYISNNSSEYSVRITGIGKSRVSEPSVLVCAFNSALRMGDRVYVKAVIYPSGESILGYERSLEDKIHIQAAVYAPTDIALISENEMNFDIMSSKIRNFTSNIINKIFKEESSSLIKAFIIGNTDELSANTVRDFRRAGVSHLLAISGLHISLIMGIAEFVLRKLYIRKSIRYVILSLSALLFLAMTGFSMSAMRSVIMLMIVYFSYLFIKENDSLTSLFASVAIIMLISPTSVKDIGLWLSFLATLGIIAVYNPLSQKINEKYPRSKHFSKPMYVFKKLTLAIMLTFICNAFICAVVWICFGEISSVSLISNLIISPLSEIFVVAVFVAAILSPIPFISSIALSVISFTEDIILKLCTVFSRISGAIISLNYPFAGIIITTMTILLIICLIVKIKKKSIILLIPLFSLISFSVCLFTYEFIHKDELKVNYYSEDKNEFIVLTQGNSSALIDFSYGGYSFLKNVSNISADSYASEISDYVITHYHNYHSSSAEKLCRSNLVRRIYLPIPETDNEKEILCNIKRNADELSVKLYLYKSGERIDLCKDSFAVILLDNNGEVHQSTSAIIGNQKETAVYVSGKSDIDSLSNIISKSDYLVIGKHFGIPDKKTNIYINFDKTKKIFVSDMDICDTFYISPYNAPIHLPIQDRKKAFFEFVLY